MSTVVVISSVGVIAVVVVVLILVLKKHKTSDNPGSKTVRNDYANSTPKIENADCASPGYLVDKSVTVGLIKDKPYKTANLCNDKVLYPLTELEVDYNLAPISEKCPCTMFIQPP